ncbi:hypothetical protein E4416_01340 [Stenotrophomonas maltophilia]|nr:hypothetical protein E4418_08755 [Stenotrophomonas maltophilia]TIK75553.1 hypothetical protein E4416_01340 [Stenotrophomonas maltophilia]
MIVEVGVALQAQGGRLLDLQCAVVAEFAVACDVERAIADLQLAIVAGVAGDAGGQRLGPAGL